MKTRFLHSLLSHPAAYRMSQRLIAGRSLRRLEQELLARLPRESGAEILDLGCGARPYSRALAGRYTGVDCSALYVERCARDFPGRFLRMDATRLAFRGRSFDAAFSVGLCHHLSREQTERGMAEWMRVLRPGGRLVVIDAILPLRRWNAPGWALRKMDRGAHVLSWREWRARFAALAPAGAELRAFGVFPYDYAVMACEIPRGKSN